jgi:hypothetical protein
MMRYAWLNKRLGACRDAGYVIGMGALLLLPLLAFTGLAVDLGSWYARAAQIQRVTDAASLGGVALLPLSEDEAIERAHAVARQNGFFDGIDGIEVEAIPVGIDQMRVRITDNNVPQYFTRMFRDEVTISRASTAEYIPPVRMGSPRNFLGTGQPGQMPGGAPAGAEENFVLSINSPCAYLEDGDLLASRNMGYATPDNGDYCNPSNGAPNPDHEARGYIYGVRVEEGYSAGDIVVEVYDGAFCSGGIDLDLGGFESFDTRFTLREPSPNPYLGTLRNQVTASSSNCGTYRTQWVPIGTIPAPEAGDTWSIQVESLNHSPSSTRGSANNFALRAYPASRGWAPCSADPHEASPQLQQATTSIDPAQCPNVFAFEHLSIFARVQGSAAEFFLASIGPEHSGKTLVIELFDPGEGGETIRVVEPSENQANPNYATFTRSVRQRFGSEVAPADGWGALPNQTSVSINRVGPAPGTNRQTDNRCRTSPTGQPNDRRCIYNERSLRLEVQLPDDITAVFNGLTWWKIRYDFRDGVDVTDRTTWSVSVKGDPVRLID